MGFKLTTEIPGKGKGMQSSRSDSAWTLETNQLLSDVFDTVSRALKWIGENEPRMVARNDDKALRFDFFKSRGGFGLVTTRKKKEHDAPFRG